MEELKDRVKWLRDHREGGSNTNMAKHIGITTGYLGDIISGRNKNPKKPIKTITEYYHVSEGWLRGFEPIENELKKEPEPQPQCEPQESDTPAACTDKWNQVMQILQNEQQMLKDEIATKKEIVELAKTSQATINKLQSTIENMSQVILNLTSPPQGEVPRRTIGPVHNLKQPEPAPRES